jgi:prepilin-type N-terminal cleavage/methylation domain-containing protein
MTPGVVSFSQAGRRRERTGSETPTLLGDLCAFSLIEIIAVLAILGILAGAVLPVLIRQIDYATEGAEATNLLALAEGFAQGGSAQQYIPSQTNWDTLIAANIGWQLTSVQINPRNNPRVFLINPGLTNLTLPYAQNSSGSPTFPANAQFMILSSLSSPLPAGLSSGVPASSDFNALWNNPNDTIPQGTSWSFGGQGADLKIQRINLASSFVHVVLTDFDAVGAPYSFTNNFTSPTLAFVAVNPPFDAYFLRGTILNLYFRSPSGNSLQTSQVLQQDTSLFFCNGLWRNAPCPVVLSGLEPIVQAFYANLAHGVGNPKNVYGDMTNYMGLYLQYSTSGFNPIYRASLQTAATGLTNDVQNLVQ